MTTGTGIAIAGMWIFAAAMGASSDTSYIGKWIGIVVATVGTIVIM